MYLSVYMDVLGYSNNLKNTKTKNIYGGSSGSLLTNWKSSFFPKRLGKIKTHRFRDYPNT